MNWSTASPWVLSIIVIKMRSTAAGGSANQLNALTGEQVGDMPDYTWADKTRRYYQTGLYLQDEMKLDRWHLDLSGRYDRIVANNSGNERRQDDHISGRAALLYAFDNGISPYVSWSQAITPTALTDPNNNLLKPTTAEQYEAGVKYQPVGTRDLYSVAVYDLTQKDVANRDVLTAILYPIGQSAFTGH